MDKYQNKYRIPSARAAFWDYSQNGAYFITICTHHRIHYFGKIEHGKMKISAIGKYAETCWNEIPQHFPFVELGAFVTMPNHIHGIIIINKSDFSNCVETQNFASLQSNQSNQSTQLNHPNHDKFGPQSQNLASIVRGFKIGVTKNARQIQEDFAWQSRFHDRIIRNIDEYQRICDYIECNPKNWETDPFLN